MKSSCLLPFVFAVITITPLAAQRAGHPEHVIPVVPIELLEKPTVIRSGIGQAHDAVTTTSRDAQSFYDQGLASLHNYDWIEAARSFNQALRLDQKLALAHVGLSVAYVELNRPKEARAALDRARGMSATVSDHERRHLELRTLQLAAEDAPTDAGRIAVYRKALDAAVSAFPKDTELLLLRGMAESPDPAERGQGSVAGSIGYYERALSQVPDHFAAHHYLTHALENSGRVNEALTHGARYAQLASAVPHARHMHGHNLRRAGRVQEAIEEFETANRLHEASFKSEAISPDLDWHYAHNLDLLASTYQYVGQIKKAEALRKRAFDLPSNLVAQLFAKREFVVFLRSRGRLPEAVTAAQRLASHPHPLIQATGRMETAATLAAAGKIADAASEFNAALRMLKASPEGAPLASTALLGLQGELSLRTAQREKGREVLLEVARRLRAMPGPDGWAQAVFGLEVLAHTARQVGDWDLAGRLAQQLLAHDSSYAGTHYLLGLVAERADDVATARAEFSLAQKYWSRADADLQELADVRARLKALSRALKQEQP